MLNFPLFAITQFDFDFFALLTCFALFTVTATLIRFDWIFGRFWHWWRFRFQRLTVPSRIGEMGIGIAEIIEGKKLFPLEQPRTSPDDLFELDHRVYGAH